MTQRNLTIFVTYIGGFFMGTALILFPAAGNLFKSPSLFGLTNSQFGLLFIPMIITAITSSLFSAKFARMKGTKVVIALGFVSLIVAMMFMASSHAFIHSDGIPFNFLFLAIALLGIGFGFMLTAINAYAFDLFSSRANTAIVALHAIIGIGQAGAPLILEYFDNLGFWWGAPLTVGLILGGILLVALSLPMKLSVESETKDSKKVETIPSVIWLFALLALVYGISEATIATWGPILLHESKGLTVAVSGVALSIFWLMITAGRVGASFLTLSIKPEKLYLSSPILMVVAYFVLVNVSGITQSLMAMGFAGLACSFFFPLTISQASLRAPSQISTVSSLMVAGIMVGVGFGNLSVGAIRDAFHLSLPSIFTVYSLFGVALAILAFYLILGRHSRENAP